jgi:hypothetical protein
VWKNNNFFLLCDILFIFVKMLLCFLLLVLFSYFVVLSVLTRIWVFSKAERNFFYCDHEKQILQWMTAVDVFHIYGYGVRFFFFSNRSLQSLRNALDFFSPILWRTFVFECQRRKIWGNFSSLPISFLFLLWLRIRRFFFLAFIFIITNKSLWTR